MSKPLKWSVDWKNLSFKDKFLMGAPFVATEDKAYKDIVRQLTSRTEKDLEAWSSFPAEVSALARELSGILKTEGIWPSDLFLPDDPADVPFAPYFDFTDKWDFLPAYIDIVEKKLGIPMDNDFWDRIAGMTYAEAITEISQKKTKRLIS
jgi:hypothetical protein